MEEVVDPGTERGSIIVLRCDPALRILLQLTANHTQSATQSYRSGRWARETHFHLQLVVRL